MKTLFSALLLSTVFLAGCSDSGSSTSSGGGTTSTIAAASSLSSAEIENLVFMREEEKLARDVYRTLFNRWNLSIFNNISGAEQTHMNTLAGMLATYGITDPITSDSTGSFNNPVLASLYDQLVARGNVSAAEAIQVGIFIEETDIADLQKAISVSTHDDLIRAYENLLQGSYNHLQSFTAQAG
ncbi:MAG: DUF2202 domain-containing protein [Gammaproteobacteria bacterium]|nr:DUF2202 domain-containing protein [Gammaproteobacteria bacterium]